MNWYSEDDKLLRRYLLDDVTAEEQRLIEGKLLDVGDLNAPVSEDQPDFVDRLLIVEDELIDDYVRGELLGNEIALFEKNFLLTPERQQKLLIAGELVKHLLADEPEGFLGTDRVPAQPDHSADSKPGQGRLGRKTSGGWRFWGLHPVWSAAACVVVAVAMGLGWWMWSQRQARLEVEKGMSALNQAYHDWRPFRSRITGLGYAPFEDARGEGQNKVDVVALKRAEDLLSGAAENEKNLAAQHALGRLYLARKEFQLAIASFEKAIQAEPDNAQLSNDLGVTLLEQAQQEIGKDPILFNRILASFDRALELDSDLLESLFNRALLRQRAYMWQQSQDDWESYLKKDANSAWAEEARINLKLLEEQRRKISQREEQLYQEFNHAYLAQDEEKVWQAFSRGHLRTGNQVIGKLVDDFLILAQRKAVAESSQRLQALSYLGKMAERKSGDRYPTELAEFYNFRAARQLPVLVQARKLLSAANLQRQNNQNKSAIDNYTQAKELFEKIGDSPEALLAGYGLGACYVEQADAEAGRKILAGTARASQERNYKWLQSLVLNGLANLHVREREYSQALANCQRARELASQISDGNGSLRSLNVMAGIYSNLGKYRDSWEAAQQGLEMAEQLAAGPSQMISLFGISAWSCNELGLHNAAISFEQEAMSLGRQMNSPPMVMSRYYVNLGLIQARQKNYEAAEFSLKKGLEIGLSAGMDNLAQEMVAYARLYLGRVYRASGNVGASIEALAQVETFGRQKNELWLLHSAAKERLLARLAQNDDDAVQAELPRVLALYDEQRAKIVEESNRNSFFAQEQDIYDLATRFAFFHRQNAAQAFEYSEIGRARSLLDNLVGGERKINDDGKRLDLLLPANTKPLSLTDIQQRMPDRTQLLQYAVLEDKLIIWLVSKHDLVPKVVDVSAENLAADVNNYLTALSRPTRKDEQGWQALTLASGKLFEHLIAPVAGWLDKGKQLCIVPDKSLHFLPFGSLLSQSGRYLVEDYVLIYAPSASLFVLCSEAAQEKIGPESEQLLSIGNPSFDEKAWLGFKKLPAAAREAKEIATHYPRHTLLIEEQASKAAVLREIEAANVVHLALHHISEPAAPMLSKLLLAADIRNSEVNADTLAAHEIYRLKLKQARLVILSACRTGATDYLKGEGAIGFLRPFEAAGVPLVIASLWAVDSQATSELMINFHRLRKRQGMATADALREAQAQMLKGTDGLYRHPYYWASFVTVGGYSQF